MDDTAVRAARIMNSQSAMLRRRMETAKPQGEPEEGGMLFKRTVQVPPNTDLERLLERWNPGVPPSTLADLVATVCRWNQIRPTAVLQPGQQLLIPTVIPHGQQPGTMAPKPMGKPMAPAAPARSNMALSSQLAEQRTRSVATTVPTTPTIWATQAQPGQNLAGAHVKQQFQANIWNRRG